MHNNTFERTARKNVRCRSTSYYFFGKKGVKMRRDKFKFMAFNLLGAFLFSTCCGISSGLAQVNLAWNEVRIATVAEKNEDEEKAVDVVCGRKVDKKDATYTYEYEGKTYYFCSQWCMTQFGMDPTSFIEDIEDKDETENKDLEW